MKKSIGKILFFAFSFIIALVVMEMAINQGNTDLTAQMGKATYPLLHMVVGEDTVNCLHGYSEDMENSYMRDTITPIDMDRNLGVMVDTYGSQVRELSYEVRGADGQRLIEDGVLETTEAGDEKLQTSLVIKDLIQQGKEYNLIFKLKLNSGQVVRYYTRLLKQEDYHVAEKVKFVKNFHQGTFDKNTAESKLATYLEPDSSGDNSTYERVDIHSSLSQVTYGELRVSEVGEPDVAITEMMKETATFRVKSMVEIPTGRTKERFLVNEYFRIRYTTERMYLLDYVRYMDQLFDETSDIYTGNVLTLGIQDQSKIQLKECDGGSIFALTVGKRLFSYNIDEGKMALLFSFYDRDNMDERTVYDNHQVFILNVEESGNIQFAVYGYMNRGRHEGSVGLQINQYNSMENIVEELVYIPYHGSPRMLEDSMEDLLYTNTSKTMYLKLDTTVYRVDLETHNSSIVAQNLQENTYQTSLEAGMFCYASDFENGYIKTMVNYNLNEGIKNEIRSSGNEYLKPLGYLDGDLIYGVAKKDVIEMDANEKELFLMNRIIIMDADGKRLKEYGTDGEYVTDCRVDGRQIILSRVKYVPETDSFEEIDDNQIVNSEAIEDGKNKVVTVPIDTYETITQVVAKSDFPKKNFRLLTPKEALFEGENEASLAAAEMTASRFFRYGLYGLEHVYTSESNAINDAYEKAGVVINDSGNYVYYRGNLVQRNQIMKIIATQVEDNQSAVAACIDTIFRFENVNRSAQYMLERGEGIRDILQDNLSDVQVLDLSGCPLDTVLFYLNQDLPILVTLPEGNCQLLTGFNETEVVVLDPVAGTLGKISKKEAEARYSVNGNRFMTYIRTGE